MATTSAASLASRRSRKSTAWRVRHGRAGRMPHRTRSPTFVTFVSFPAIPFPQMRRALSLVVISIAAVGLLHATGGRLAGPGLTHPAGWAHWALARPPVEVGMAAVRLLALGAAWYLLGLGLLATAAALPGLRPLATVAGALALPTLRPLLGVAVAAAPVRAPVPTVTLHRLDPAPAPVVAAVPATAPHESTWTVARGDSFWSMAEQTLGHAWKR